MPEYLNDVEQAKAIHHVRRALEFARRARQALGPRDRRTLMTCAAHELNEAANVLLDFVQRASAD